MRSRRRVEEGWAGAARVLGMRGRGRQPSGLSPVAIAGLLGHLNGGGWGAGYAMLMRAEGMRTVSIG
jgi:hypothetical protein